MAGRPPKENSRDKQYHVRLNDEEDEYEDCDMGGISLKRTIECPYCGAANNIDFAEYSETSEDKRRMGNEVEHYFDVEDCYCEECEKRFRVHGSIWEYPLGLCNDEDISVQELE